MGGVTEIEIKFRPGTPLYEMVNEIMRKMVEFHGGDYKEAARSLQVSAPTLIRRLGLEKNRRAETRLTAGTVLGQDDDVPSRPRGEDL